MATAGEGGGEFSVASDPDFAAVCSFLQVFGPACALDVPSISDLQRLLEDTQEVADALRELHLKLLRRAVKWVKPERWERALIKFCHQHGLHKEAWELERFSYKKASSRVKLTLLKVLLEYQFTCHTKFKNSVNALKSTELRLEPVGRDRGGRVYWLHTDSEANLRLYREDQDEETWSLIARDRDGLMKVIGQLKNSEDSETVDETLLNEDSNSLEASLTVKEKKDEDNEDSNEEFLSPESETDHESDSNQELKDVTENKAPTSINDEMKSKGDLDLKETLKINSDPADEPKSEKHNPETESKDHTEESDTRPQKEFKVVSSEELPITSPENTKAETLNVIKDSTLEEIKISEEKYEENVSSIITVVENKIESKKPNDDLEPSEDTVGPAIEEPIMLVTGEGSGADCEGVWEEICEPVMYIWGAGCGVECSTGNPGEIVAKASTHEDTLGNTNPPIEGLVLAKTSSCNNIPTENNGANSSDVDSNYKSNKQGNDVLENCSDKLKSENHQPITKRVLQETSEDTVSEHKQVESTPKKPCIWNVESMVKKSESSDDACFEKKLTGNKITKKTNCKSEENGCKVEDGKLKIEQSGSNSNADELKQSASKCKKKYVLSNDEEVNSADDLKPNPEGSGKKNIVEKRKSSLSSEDDKCVKIPDSEENSSPSGKKQSGKHKAKPRNKGNAKTFCKPDIESLPPKKLRLDSSTDDYDKEISDKSTLVNRRSKKIVKNDSPNKRESRKTLSIVSNCSTENKDSTEVDESGILIKEIKVGHHSNNVEKNDLEGGVATKDCESDAKEPTPQRSIRKVGRGKLRRRLLKKPVEKVEEAPVDSDSDKNLDELAQKRKVTPVRPTDASSEKSTSLKRGLQPEKRKRNRNQDNSVSEEENEELLTGKRLKIKPKKIVLSSRKKVEEKVNNRKDSSEDSEEVEVAPKRGKVKRSSSPKKELKEKSAKKNKKKRGSEGKSKKSRGGAEGGVAEESGEDVSPVRQSRRIAQLKIREEAERRQMEEVALRELKMKHKKTKTEEGEEEWKASGASSDSEEERRGAQRRRGNKWPASDTSQPSSGSDTDERLFDREYEEPDLVFKSDHEFSPESDIEDDSSSEPLKRARTLKEEAEGFCTRCGRGDHPEWILLCDDCDSGYHASCLKPVLFLVPDGDWFCPPCQHQRLIAALEEQLVKYDELAKIAEVGKTKRRKLELEAKQEAEEEEKRKKKSGSEEESSSEWSSSDEGTVYRLRERRQVPVSLRAQEYDRLMSSAIKEEYKEPESSAGNQGRGKDISTIIEAAEEEKQKELEAAQQSGAGGGEAGGGERRSKPRRPRRKPRKLNSLEVPSEDDNDTDEDFKEAGWETSSESISSDAEGDTRSESRSSDSLPIRRSGREGKKSRKKIVESPELKKKKGVFEDTSSESSGAKDWANKKKQSPKKRYDKTFPKKSKKKRGLKQYDAEGNVIKQRVKYGGLSGSEGSNDWSPKHRTRQKKINYTEMPNTESEDEMHKPSGKHMPDSSDEYRLDDSDDSDSEAGRGGGGAGAGAGEGDGDGGGAPAPGAADGTAADEHKVNALRELVKKTAVVPLHKLPEDVTRAKAEALEAQLNARVEAVVGTATPRAPRGRGGRGGRGSRGPRRGGAGRGRSPGTAATSAATPTTPGDPLSNLVGVKIKDLSQRDATPTANQVEREKKRVEREARIAEKEARKLERLKKKEEREQLREQKARERDEKRAAKAALAEGRRQRRDKTEGLPVPIPIAGYGAPPRPARPDGARMGLNINQQVGIEGSTGLDFADFQRMRQAGSYRPGGGGGAGPGEGTPMPRLQVRPELRAMRPDLANVRAHHPPPPHAAPHPPHPPHYPAQHHAERRDAAMREGTLSVAGSPQPFKPATDPPSIITRMPHMMPPQYRGPPMYMSGSPYGPPPPGARPPHMMYMHPHPHAHPLDPSPSGGGPINMNSRHPYPAPGPGGGYYPRGYPPPRFPPPHAEPSVSTPPPAEPKIKSEIKTEPEAAAGSPPASPPPSAHPPPPHPKIKHTESKERARTTAAARFPHGPYAPQYGPYGPYAPPPPDGYGAPMHPMHSTPPPGGHRMPPPPHSRPPPPHHLAAPPGAHHMPPGAPHPPPGTHHPSTGAPHPPPGTHHPSTGAPHPPPGTHHPSTGAPHPPPGTHHPSTGAPHPPPGAPHPPPGGTHHSSPGAPHPPPGAPHPPPGAHHTPPGAHHPPPGAPHPPPGAHHTQPGAHHPPPGAPHLPPGAHHTQPGAHHPPPGAPHPPPGAHHTQPGAHHPPPGAPHPPPGAHHTQPGAHHPPPGAPHPPPGAHHMPPGTPHPPPGAPHPPPGAHHMPPGAHHPPPGVHHPPPGAHHPPPQHPPAGPHHSSPHRPTPPPLPHHSAPPPLRHAPTAAHHAGPHHLPAPLHVPPGPPHRPASPMTSHTTPPPSLQRRTPEPLHNPEPKKVSGEPVNRPPSADSVNLVAHERLRSPSPPPPPAPAAPRSPAERTSPARLAPLEPTAPKAPEPPAEAPGDGEPRAAPRGPEDGVFGGLVSYFSSQQEDDLDG